MAPHRNHVEARARRAPARQYVSESHDHKPDAPTKAGCGCIAKVNGHLAELNTKLTLPIIGPQRPFVETMKLDDKKRGKPAMMFASFCPFCGVKYPKEKDPLRGVRA